MSKESWHYDPVTMEVRDNNFRLIATIATNHRDGYRIAAAPELLAEGLKSRDLLRDIVARWATDNNVETWSWFSEAKAQAQAWDVAIRKATED